MCTKTNTLQLDHLQ